jgi:hypothetical protein
MKPGGLPGPPMNTNIGALGMAGAGDTGWEVHPALLDHRSLQAFFITG